MLGSSLKQSINVVSWEAFKNMNDETWNFPPTFYCLKLISESFGDFSIYQSIMNL